MNIENLIELSVGINRLAENLLTTEKKEQVREELNKITVTCIAEFDGKPPYDKILTYVNNIISILNL